MNVSIGDEVRVEWEYLPAITGRVAYTPLDTGDAWHIIVTVHGLFGVGGAKNKMFDPPKEELVIVKNYARMTVKNPEIA